MATAKKLEEKHQKILRQLQSLPDNKICAECPARGPGFVNLFNHSFVCMRCSGLLRDFNHRLKSVSAAIFTPEEIRDLQEGGNQVCRETYLATYKPSDYATPNGSDAQALKDWMRLKYVTKRWYREAPKRAVQAPATTPTETTYLATPATMTRASLSQASQPAQNNFDLLGGQGATEPSSAANLFGAVPHATTAKAPFAQAESFGSFADSPFEVSSQLFQAGARQQNSFGNSSPFGNAALQAAPASQQMDALGTSYAQQSSVSQQDSFGFAGMTSPAQPTLKPSGGISASASFQDPFSFGSASQPAPKSAGVSNSSFQDAFGFGGNASSGPFGVPASTAPQAFITTPMQPSSNSPFATAPMQPSSPVHQAQNAFGAFSATSTQPSATSPNASSAANKYDIFREEVLDTPSLFGSKQANNAAFTASKNEQAPYIAGANPFASAHQQQTTPASMPFQTVPTGMSPFGSQTQPNAFGGQLQQTPFQQFGGQSVQNQFQQSPSQLQQQHFGAAGQHQMGQNPFTAPAPQQLPQQQFGAQTYQAQQGANPFGQFGQAQAATQPRQTPDPFVALSQNQGFPQQQQPFGAAPQQQQQSFGFGSGAQAQQQQVAAQGQKDPFSFF